VNWDDFPGHRVTLETERLILRPFRESDFEVALSYYADPELRAAMEGDPDAPATLEYLKAAGIRMASDGFLFALELKGDHRVIGEACVQRMNLDRAAAAAGERVFRMPIGIWDKTLWGGGLGGEVVDRLLDFAFVVQDADRVCAMSVGQDNLRSRALFESRGLRVVRTMPAERAVDLEITRADYFHSLGIENGRARHRG
jgi:RimJ/RimL family protein N-acetyltransferase